MRPLVILRPEPGASATANAAEEMGLTPIVMPLFRVEPIAWEAPDPDRFDGLLLTSANAIRYACGELGRLRHLPAYCVGESTASATRAAGLEVADVGRGGVDALLDSLPEDLKLLHLTAAHWREPRRSRQSIRHVPVYQSVELPRPHRFGAVAGAVAAVHSPRAASAFERHIDQAGVPRAVIAIAAIGPEAAEAVGNGWETVEAAIEPNDAALLAIAVRLCNKPG